MSCYDGIVTLGDRVVVFGGGGVGDGLDMGSYCLITKIIAESVEARLIERSLRLAKTGNSY